MPHRWKSLLVAVALAAPVAGRAQTTVVVLVRHAEKAAAPVDDPPLTDAGRVRAEALSAALADWAADAILITPTTRTRETAAPFAKRRGLTPVLVPNSGTIAVRADSLAQLIRRAYAGKRVVVVGHSNTIPAIIGALGGPRFGDLCDDEHSRLFVLTIPPPSPGSAGGGTPELIRSSYGPADRPGADGCRPMK